MQWSYCKSGEELVITKINNTLEQVGMILQIVWTRQGTFFPGRFLLDYGAGIRSFPRMKRPNCTYLCDMPKCLSMFLGRSNILMKF